ncbi:MAG: hypothetical protein PHC41_11360 [Lachnospiraceae bacterium]|nr:hypothetical protein [Lachnospiraceae bacterium]MDD3616805.1 hypothetical protein [Lachnospiraceae bacterium]
MSEVEVSKEALEKAQKSLEKFEQSVRGISSKAARIRDVSIEQGRRRVDGLKKTIEAEEKRVKNCDKQLTQIKHAIHDCGNENEEEKKRRQQLEYQRMNLEAELRNCKNELSKNKSKLDKLKSAFHSMEEEVTYYSKIASHFEGKARDSAGNKKSAVKTCMDCVDEYLSVNL